MYVPGVAATCGQATEEGALAGPLADVRVVDLAGESGQFAGRLLAQLGADVIRVEPPEGSPVRSRQPFLDGVQGRERSLYHLHFNAGKRGITLDYRSEQGSELLRRLAAASQMLIETAPPGEMDALGLGFESLREESPRLLYGTVTPFGQEGPMRDYRAPDIVASAMSGLMYLNGDPSDPPNQPAAEQAYHMASLALVSAALIALVGQDRGAGDGPPGRRIDVSIQEAASMATLQNAPPNAYAWHGTVARRRGNVGLNGGRNLYQCRDGRWVSFTVPPYRWDEFIEWLEEEAIESEARTLEFRDASYRQANGTITSAAVFVLTERYGAEYLFHEGQRRGLLVMLVNDVEQLTGDRQLKERGYFAETRHALLGRTLTDAGTPMIFSGERPQVGRVAPSLGEHNEEVYQGLLGLSDDELERLREEGVA
ncbi:MAG: CaiB/BaiF CoA-transferase family protein [Vicinamibacterales bacterium]|nr:CaiB/BaiF CoA-transferase family protein [Vicinamibacterales bacterium]